MSSNNPPHRAAVLIPHRRMPAPAATDNLDCNMAAIRLSVWRYGIVGFDRADGK
ncbi:MAG: hypothetical protein ACXU85_11655 [Xanthobacteraceae bacterium]